MIARPTLKVGEELATFKVHAEDIFAVAVNRDGTEIVTSGLDPWIGITDLGRLAGYIRGSAAYWRERLSGSDADRLPGETR